MLKETLAKIERAVRRTDSLGGTEKKKLLGLLATLKSEVERLSEAHEDQAHAIAGYAELATREATRAKKSPGLLEHTLKGLGLSAKEFEASHPKLAETINDLCVMLSRIGI